MITTLSIKRGAGKEWNAGMLEEIDVTFKAENFRIYSRTLIT